MPARYVVWGILSAASSLHPVMTGVALGDRLPDLVGSFSTVVG